MSGEIEQLARQIHGVYCNYCREVKHEEYWTKGNYDLLDEETKEADRYMARFILSLPHPDGEAECEWIHGDENWDSGWYKTACGKEFIMFEESKPTDFNFCCYCGRKLVIASPTPGRS